MDEQRVSLKVGMEEDINANWAKLVRQTNMRWPKDQEHIRNAFRKFFEAGFVAGMKFGMEATKEGPEHESLA